MKCPYCAHNDDRVLDTRVQKDGSIRRRRECLECKARFTTVETLMLNFPLIIKKDGRREAYSKEKILRGLQAACQKRPVSLTQLEAVVERISAWIINRGENEISSRIIGKKVMAELKQLDDEELLDVVNASALEKALQKNENKVVTSDTAISEDDVLDAL